MSKPYNDSSEERRSAEDKALDRFADMMVAKIEGINEDWKKPWFTEGSLSWPKNLDGRDYNGLNALMLMMHCENEGFKVPVFMTFDRVKGLNYKGGRKTGGVQAVDKEGKPLPEVSVNKGAKSFPVFLTTFTVVDPETHEKIKYDDYKQLSDDEKSKYRVFPKLNVFNVFNVDQTNLAESRPQLYQKLQEANNVKRPEGMDGEGQSFVFPAVDEMIRDNKWLCPIKPKYGDDAYYSISKDEIVVPEKKQFVDGESFYGTLFHEMTHSTGAESRLNRLAPTGFGSKEYAREELVAELGSALVAQRYGISKHVKEDSAAYIKSWLDSLKESPDFIRTTLLDVKKASQIIVDHVEKMEVTMQQTQEEHQEVAQEKQEAEQKPKTEAIAAKESVRYSIYCAATGRYVGNVRNPVVGFVDSKEDALTFSSKEMARAAARECKLYVPDLRFTVKPVTIEQKQELGPLKDLGTYSVPEWALPYMENGDRDNLTDKEVAMVDSFVKENFPNGYLMEVDWDKSNDFNLFPAFGERSQYASPIRGESPFLAVKTYQVNFLDPVEREQVMSRMAVPQKQPTSDELGIIERSNDVMWSVRLVGAYDTSDLAELRLRARTMGGVPSGADPHVFYFLKEANAVKFNTFRGAFQAVDVDLDTAKEMVHQMADKTEDRQEKDEARKQEDARRKAEEQRRREEERKKKEEKSPTLVDAVIATMGIGLVARLSELSIELRGESRTPWISGKVDGEPILAERVSMQEYNDYRSGKLPIEKIGLEHFQDYLNMEPEQDVSQGMHR